MREPLIVFFFFFLGLQHLHQLLPQNIDILSHRNVSSFSHSKLYVVTIFMFMNSIRTVVSKPQ